MNRTLAPLLGLVEFSPNPTWLHTAARELQLDTATESGAFLAGTELPQNGGHTPRSPYFLTADIFLFNPDELVAALGSDLPVSAHKDIVLAAYAKWGVDCAPRLEGELSFAIFDPVQQHLFCVRDQFARRPFLYWHGGTRLVIGTELEDLLRVPGVPRALNRPLLAATDVPLGQFVLEGQTYHAGIMGLPFGCYAIASERGFKLTRYWAPGPGSATVPKNPEDAYTEFRDLIVRAVERRVNRPCGIGILLSGGLDSGCIAAVAAKVLERQGRTLTALTTASPPKDLDRFPDERKFLEPFRAYPNIRFEDCVTDDSGPFDWLDNPAKFTAMCHPHPMFHATFASVERMKAAGTGVILTGIGGEAGATYYARRFLAEMFLAGRWQLALREARMRAALTGFPALRLVLGSFRTLVFRRTPDTPLFMLTRGFAAESEVDAPPLPIPFQSEVENMASCATIFARRQSVRPNRWLLPVQEATPLLDKSVLEFCIAAPAELRVRDGHLRYLARGAMAGVMPESLRLRTDKMPFIPNYPERYTAQLPAAKAFVAQIRRSDPVRSVVDVPRLVRELTPPIGAENCGRLMMLPNTIRLIQFLRQFPEFQS